jgi:hypothetical protein
VIDKTGIVLGCDRPDRSMFDWTDDHPPQIGNPGGDTRLLQVEWAGDPCGAAREFTLSRTGTAFALESRSTYTGEYCVQSRVIHTILLSVNAPIDSSNVIFDWSGQPNVGTDTAEAAGIAFELTLSADKREYSRDEAIEVWSSLRSESNATVTGLIGPMFGLEQLDGDLRFDPGPFLAICPPPTELAGGIPRERTMEWPSDWSADDPNAPFYDNYLRDGVLLLPAGTYRFYAFSDLRIGDTCGGDRVELEASIVVTVR